MNYAVKDIEMVPGRRGGICLCVNTVREAMYRYIFQAKKKKSTTKKKPNPKPMNRYLCGIRRETEEQWEK